MSFTLAIPVLAVLAAAAVLVIAAVISHHMRS